MLSVHLFFLLLDFVLLSMIQFDKLFHPVSEWSYMNVKINLLLLCGSVGWSAMYYLTFRLL